jgi:hypothetical protein
MTLGFKVGKTPRRFWAALNRSARRLLPVVPRRNLQDVGEGATHLLFVAKPAIFGDRGDPVVGFLQEAPCLFDPNRLDGFRWSSAALLGVDASDFLGLD